MASLDCKHVWSFFNCSSFAPWYLFLLQTGWIRLYSSVPNSFILTWLPFRWSISIKLHPKMLGLSLQFNLIIGLGLSVPLYTICLTPPLPTKGISVLLNVRHVSKMQDNIWSSYGLLKTKGKVKCRTFDNLQVESNRRKGNINRCMEQKKNTNN